MLNVSSSPACELWEKFWCRIQESGLILLYLEILHWTNSTVLPQVYFGTFDIVFLCNLKFKLDATRKIFKKFPSIVTIQQ